ncbi:hypothetical protein ACWT_1091 [Actinoplanes sp. SE50]|uniref:CcdC protein domain-containing protein n=1 Tax=unclassified Actinoplanes TaxID=2626549 RepID=UPI00023ECDF3|nr:MULTISPECIES: CcdC protein domain-containing protein [unclassified Actinoplanes]AEV82107.1 hypothetical protein ACPL_1210 [Actinoplanes sp. SE50/110]ATO80506.1 hypothetical protein ACWT_1091 [Actinoplanes sp. SE50]SLL97912.1 hypothetical protein ACSP50_1128 [Actinoplanes sp. SE50/110]
MEILTPLLVIAALAYAMVRRYLGEPLTARRLVVLPLALTVYGGFMVAQAGLTHVRADVVALAVGGVLAVAGGALRGATVRVMVRDGHLWYRYTWVTLTVWIGLIVLRLVQATVAGTLGADRPVLAASLVLALGLSFLGEAAVVGPRAMAVGAPFAPRRSRRRVAAGR